MIARLAEAARADVPSAEREWVAMEQVAVLSSKMARALQGAVHAGWDKEAERRRLVERRDGQEGINMQVDS